MRLALFITLLVTVLIGGCSSEQPTLAEPTGNVVEFDLEVFNWGFNQEDVQIKAGDTVRITVKNTDGRHGVSFPQFATQTGTMQEGEETLIEFIATKAGKYDFFCNVPCGKGHSSMKGFFEVLT